MSAKGYTNSRFLQTSIDIPRLHLPHSCFVPGRWRVRIRDRRPTILFVSVFPSVTQGKFWGVKPVKKREERAFSHFLSNPSVTTPHVCRITSCEASATQQPRRRTLKSLQNMTESLRPIKLLFVAIPRRERPSFCCSNITSDLPRF